MPIVNASLTEKEDEIVLHDRYHVGIAVSTPAGLVVPVIHDADKMDLVQIAGAIDRLSTQAREGKIRLEDLRGATFTITSIGNIGGLFATPIISPPQVGILGLGKIVRRPVFDETRRRPARRHSLPVLLLRSSRRRRRHRRHLRQRGPPPLRQPERLLVKLS